MGCGLDGTEMELRHQNTHMIILPLMDKSQNGILTRNVGTIKAIRVSVVLLGGMIAKTINNHHLHLMNLFMLR